MYYDYERYKWLWKHDSTKSERLQCFLTLASQALNYLDNDCDSAPRWYWVKVNMILNHIQAVQLSLWFLAIKVKDLLKWYYWLTSSPVILFQLLSRLFWFNKLSLNALMSKIKTDKNLETSSRRVNKKKRMCSSNIGRRLLRCSCEL